jgi:hypothetical protein
MSKQKEVRIRKKENLSMTKCRLMEGSGRVKSSDALTPQVKTLVSTRRKGERLRRLYLITSVLK